MASTERRAGAGAGTEGVPAKITLRYGHGNGSWPLTYTADGEAYGAFGVLLLPPTAPSALPVGGWQVIHRPTGALVEMCSERDMALRLVGDLLATSIDWDNIDAATGITEVPGAAEALAVLTAWRKYDKGYR